MKSTNYIFVLLFFFLGKLFSQEPFFKQFTSDDGLISLANYNIIQDKNNLIWLGSEEGLFFYDGKKFEQLKSDIVTTSGAFNLQKDTNGKIWFSTISGHIFKVENKKLVLFKDLSKELKGAFAHLIVMKNSVFFLSQKKSFQFDKTGKIQTNLNAEISKTIKTKNGFYYYNLKEKNVLTHVTEKGGKIEFNKISYNFNSGKIQLFNLYKNVVVSLRKNENYLINTQNDSIYKEKLPKEIENLQVYNTKQNDNDFWLLTSKGIIIVEKKNDKFIVKKQFFKNYHFTDLLKDNEQNIWLTTLHNGVLVIPNMAIEKEMVLNEKDDIISIASIAKNDLLLGTQNGTLIRFNTKTKNTTKLSLFKERPVNKIHVNKELNEAYVSTNSTYGYKFNIATNTINKPLKNEFSTSKGFAQISKDSLVYLSYRNAVLYTNLKNNLTKVELENKRPISVFYDKYNLKTYISFIDETLIYNQKFQSTPILYKNKNIIFSDFKQTQNKIVWGVSKNKIYAINNAVITDSVTVHNGLIQSRIKGFSVNENNLWIVFSKGIQKYNTKTKELITIKLAEKEAIKFKSPLIKNNTLWIAGNPFLCKIDLLNKNLIKKKSTPKAYISNVFVEEQEQKKQTEYQLPYNVNSIAFKLKTNGFLASKQNVFEYKLKGYNNQWKTTELNEDIVRYIGIPSGNYEFLLRTKSLDGTLGEISEKIKVIVKEPFWKSIWFLITLFLLVTILVITYYKLKIIKQEQEAEKELEKVILDSRLSKLKLENLRSQMNPHFIFNSLGAIQDYVMKNERYLASDYLVKFSRLIRTYLNHSRLNKITLKEEIESLKIYMDLEQLRFENKFKIHFTVSENLAQETINVPPLFIQPFVENAIKHGLVHKKESGNLWILIKEQNEKTLKIIVEDDGVGRKKSSEINKKRNGHKSFAVNAIQERISLYKKEKLFDILVNFKDKISKTNISQGTLVTITIKKM